MAHLDLDCLDSSLGRANKFAAPGGLFEGDLVKRMNEAATKTRPVADCSSI